MEYRQPNGPEAPSPTPASCRDFLQQAAGLGAGFAALASTVQAADQATGSAPLLPQIQLGSHRVTRLIIGGNPIYGYSHFNRHFDRHLTAWHTPSGSWTSGGGASSAG